MADKSITELSPARAVYDDDSFVLEQNNHAMRLTGQVLTNYLLAKMDGHGGINRIVKTATSGLTDTYTITYADQSTSTYTVANGRGITGIAKTATDALEDTYTISYNDNTTSTFTVTNGCGIVDIQYDGTSGLVDTYTITLTNGDTSTFTVTNGCGISNITKSTSGLEDTYTMSLTDGNSFDFTVTNGRSINNITKTNTEDLVDTYTISYNDNTTSTFTVTNGEKGDEGERTYVWIKYSHERPIRDTDLKNDADDWIGIYTGTEDVAPTSYSSYQWYEYKGEKGEKGDSIELDDVEIKYQKSESGTIAPTSWLDTIPPVPAGQYLWTRVNIIFRPDGDITYYTCVKNGVDGTGSVASVCGVSPDSHGDVDLVSVVDNKLVIG